MVGDTAEELRHVLEWLKGALGQQGLSPKAKELVESLKVAERENRAFLTSHLHAVWEKKGWDETKSRVVHGVLPNLSPCPVNGKPLIDIRKERRLAEFTLVWGDPPPWVRADDLNYQAVTEWLKGIPDTTKLKKVTLIQHHGGASEALRHVILQQTTATIDLYMQAPDKTCCERQKIKVQSYLDNFPNLQESMDPKILVDERLNVFVYDVHASIRAVLVDDRLVGVGWYMYHPSKVPTETEIWGNMLPTVYAESGSTAFGPLSDLVRKWLNTVGSKSRRVYPPVKDGGPPVKVETFLDALSKAGDKKLLGQSPKRKKG